MTLASSTVSVLIAFPFALQAIALTVDEFVFHWRRGLPRWECLGHPLDTLTVLSCFLLVHFVPFDSSALLWFVGLSLFSCLFVTKDEWVHARLCDAREQWLHALLFICHPLVFVSAAVLWCWRDVPESLGLEAAYAQHAARVITGQTLILCVFLAYQVIYWNFVRRPISGSDGK